MNSRLPVLGAAIWMALGSTAAGAVTFPVTNTSDSGGGSLRQAILDANASLGADTIQFAIPGSGLHTIHALSTMNITDTVTIDGFTQAGSSPNSLAVGNDAVYEVEIDGSGLPFTNNLFNVNFSASGSTIRGLVIHDVPGVSINIDADDRVVIGNFIGTDVTGSANMGTPFNAVRLGKIHERLGGTAPADRNVILGGSGFGAEIVGLFNSHDSTIQGNYIGVNAAGTAALVPNPLPTSGLNIFAAHDNLIGGTAAGAGNVIFGNSYITLGGSAIHKGVLEGP